MINFFNVHDIESCNSASGRISEELKEIFNQTDRNYDMRYDRDFKEILIRLEEIENKILSSGIENKDMARILDLVKSNLFLRKGQAKDEDSKNPCACYDQAACLLQQGINPDGKSEVDYLYRLAMGKYYRNMGKYGKSSRFTYASEVFQGILYDLDETRKERELESWERHIWMDAKINTGKVKRSWRKFEEAAECFWQFINTMIPLLDQKKTDALKNNAGLNGDNQELKKDSLAAGELDLKYNKDMAEADSRFFENYLLQALVQLGIVYRKKRQKKEAIEVFGWVLCIDENNIDAMNNIDICNKKEVGDVSGSPVNEEKKAVERENKNTKFARLCNIKKGLESWDRYDKKKRGEIEGKIKKELKKNSNDRDVLMLLGKLYIKNGKFKKAYKIFSDIFNKYPYVRKGSIGLKSYYNMASCIMAQKDYRKAAGYMQEILVKCEGDDLLAQCDLGWCWIMLGGYDKARGLFEDLIKNDKYYKMGQLNKMQSRNNLGLCYLRLNQIEDAEKMAGLVLKEEENNAVAMGLLAQCYMTRAEKQEDLQKKIEMYEKAVIEFEKASAIRAKDKTFNSGYVISLAELWNKTKKPEYSEKLVNSLLYKPMNIYTMKACVSLSYFISGQPEDTAEDRKKKDKLYKFFAKINISEDSEGASMFYTFLNKVSFHSIDMVLRGKIMACLLRIYESVIKVKIRCRLKVKESDRKNTFDNLVHYTKYNTLKILLARDNVDGQGEGQQDAGGSRLRLWNSVYMNDYNEGEIFISAMEEIMNKKSPEILEKYFTHLGKSTEELTPLDSNVYFTSFSRKVDELWMWIAYADNAKGCGLFFDENFFDVMDEVNNPVDYSAYTDNDYPLYEIQYVGEEGIDKTIYGYMENIGEELERLESLLNEESDNIEADGEYEENWKLYDAKEYKKKQWTEARKKIRSFVADCLNEIRFLFKNPEYEYEDEVRMIRCSYNPGVDEKNFDVPRLYIEVDREIKLGKVQLGPKVGKSETNEIVSWVNVSGRVEKISKSRRHYQ